MSMSPSRYWLRWTTCDTLKEDHFADCLKPKYYQSTSDATIVSIVFLEGHAQQSGSSSCWFQGTTQRSQSHYTLTTSGTEGQGRQVILCILRYARENALSISHTGRILNKYTRALRQLLPSQLGNR